MNPRPGAAENIDALAGSAAPSAPDAVRLTVGPSDEREARLRALFTLFFHEAGMEPPPELVAAIAAAAARLGYALVPVRR